MLPGRSRIICMICPMLPGLDLYYTHPAQHLIVRTSSSSSSSPSLYQYHYIIIIITIYQYHHHHHYINIIIVVSITSQYKFHFQQAHRKTIGHPGEQEKKIWHHTPPPIFETQTEGILKTSKKKTSHSIICPGIPPHLFDFPADLVRSVISSFLIVVNYQRIIHRQSINPR